MKIYILLLLNIFLFANEIKLTKEEQNWIKNNIVKVGVSPWYPLTFYSKDKTQVDGIGVEILDKLAKKVGLKITYVPNRWDVLLNDFKKHKIDLLPTTYYTQQRATYGHFTTAYLTIKEFLYVRNDSNINGFDDVRSVSIVKSYGTIDKIRKKYPNIKIVEVDTLEDSIKLVLDKKVDAVFNTQFAIESYIKNSLITGLKPVLQTDFKASTLHYFVNKQKPILYSIMQKLVDGLEEDEKNQVLFKWINKANLKLIDVIPLNSYEKKYIKQYKIIKMCNNPNWKPIEFLEDNTNKVSGIVIDVLKIIEKRLDVKFEHIKTSSWSESQQFLKDKKCDILPAVIKTKQREKYANFTKPYLHYKLAIITKDDKPFVSSIENILDKTIARKKGSGLIQILKEKYPNIKIIETNDYIEAFKKVSSGEVYCAIATLPVASYYIKKFALNNLRIAGYINEQYNLSIAVRKDNIILKDILDKALQTITRKDIKDINNQWMYAEIKQVSDYTWILYVVFILILIGILLIYKQNSLKKDMKKVQGLLDATMQASILHKDCIIVEANEIALKMFKIKDKDKILGKSFIDSFISEEYKDIVHSQVKKERTKQYEAVLLRADGSRFYALVQGVYLKEYDMRLASVIDITKLKEKDKFISQQSRFASMGELITNIAHHWRQPLSVISVVSTGVRLKKEQGVLDDDEIYEACDMIDKNINYLSKTIEDFRSFAKKDEYKDIFDLNKIISDSIFLIDSKIKDENVRLLKEFENNLNVKGYAGELKQVIISIVNNSIDIFNQREIKYRIIFIKTYKEGDNAVISIKDNGGGIEEENISRIFEPYFTTKHKYQGVGLGLHMAYNTITNGFKGDIIATNEKFVYNSVEYYGANFIIKIPLN